MAILFLLLVLCSAIKAALPVYAGTSLYEYNYSIGQFNVTKYVNENGNSIFPESQNLLCAKASYFSPNVFYSYVDKHLFLNATGNKGSRVYSKNRFYGFMTVNRHGKPDVLDVTGIIQGFTVEDTDISVGMHICVYHEPLTTDSEDTAYEAYSFISADWLVLQDGFFSADNCKVEKFSSGHALTNGTSCINVQLRNQTSTATIAGLRVDNYETNSEIVYWMDTIEMICSAFPSSEEFTSMNPNNTFYIISLYGSNKLNDGLPSSFANSYKNEYGNTVVYPESETVTENWRTICLDKAFVETYTTTPHIFVTASFRNKKSSVGSYESPTTAWVEFSNELGFRACVSKPSFVTSLVTSSATPSIEYLIISVDGIYNTNTEKNKQEKVAIILEMEFPGGSQFFVDTATLFDFEVDYYLSDIALTIQFPAIVNHGFLANPNISNKVYQFVAVDHYEYSYEEVKSDIIDPILKHFADGVFPYAFELCIGAERYRDAVYPNGFPAASEMVKVVVHFDHGCVFGPFDAGECSVDSCGGDGGVKTITRVIDDTFPSSLCPPTTRSVKCNMGPCSFSNNATFILKDEPDDGDNDDGGNDNGGNDDPPVKKARVF